MAILLPTKDNLAPLLNFPCCRWLYQWNSQNTLTKNLVYRAWLTSHPSKLSCLLTLWQVHNKRPDAPRVLGRDWQCLFLVSQRLKLPDTGEQCGGEQPSQCAVNTQGTWWNTQGTWWKSLSAQLQPKASEWAQLVTHGCSQLSACSILYPVEEHESETCLRKKYIFFFPG